MRIAVTVKKGEDPNVVVNQLFEYSPLQDTFSVIMLALVDGRPKTLPLKDLLRLFVEHRVNVIRRRTQYQLRQARERAHIVEGLLIALAYIDEIIRVIRSSANPPEARIRLMGIAVSAEILRRALDDPEAKEATGLTRMQADAILIMQLQRLTGLEADKLAQEYIGLKADIAGYERILADERLILDIIRADLREMKEQVRQRAPEHDLRRGDRRLRQGGADPRGVHGGDRHARRLHQAAAAQHLSRPGQGRAWHRRHQHQGRRLPRADVRRPDPRLHPVLHRQGEGLLAEGLRPAAGDADGRAAGRSSTCCSSATASGSPG